MHIPPRSCKCRSFARLRITRIVAFSGLKSEIWGTHFPACGCFARRRSRSFAALTPSYAAQEDKSQRRFERLREFGLDLCISYLDTATLDTSGAVLGAGFLLV